MAAVLDVRDLGCVPYDEALVLQTELVAARRHGEGRDTLLLLEHPPTVTLGRGADEANLRLSREALARRGVAVCEAARGGDVTYHAPGQLVGYPIIDLAARDARDVHRYLRTLEAALIEALADLGVPARRVEGRTGVFAASSPHSCAGRDRKLASIGVGLRGWVTYHGFALNLDLDLAGFDAIVPCGLHDVDMTSVERELGAARPSDLRVHACAAVSNAFVRHLGSRVG